MSVLSGWGGWGGGGADLCACGDGFADEDLALGEVVVHGCCGAELADCLGRCQC